MNKFYEHIVKKRKIIIIAFLIAFAVCLICKQFVAVDYDMYDYLPEESASTKALELMNKEYDGGIPNARVMIENISVPEALDYKEKILDVDGVTDVTWLDDVVNITTPFEMSDSDTAEKYYKDNNALFSVTIEESKRKEAVSEIRKIIGPDNAMSGSAVTTAYATESTVKEVSKITIFAVIFVLIVLIITTTSFAEPLIVLAGLGVAIVINGGSNLIFGEISFVTNAAGSIQQLAVSLDYSVFLLHRFTECRKTSSDPEKAMVQALSMSTYSDVLMGLLGKMNADTVYDESYQAVLQQMTEQISTLKGQLDNYGTFYQGLITYTDAVSNAASGANSLKLNMDKLYSSTGVLATSVGTLNDAVAKLYDGTTQLADGTNEFAEKTDGMDEQVGDEIDSMVSSISGNNEPIHSFISDKNIENSYSCDY